MKLVRPATIDDTAFISSNVPEDDAAAWTAGTYATGVEKVHNHRLYEVIASPSTATEPGTEAGADAWLDLGATNPWKMFDTINGSQTVGVPEIVVQVQPAGRVDSVALLNLDANYVQVIITDAIDGTVFSEEFNLVQNDGILDIYAYYYEPIVRKTDLIITGITPYVAPTIQISVSNSGEDTKVGTAIVGQARDMGATLYGASIGIKDYSRIDVELGVYTLVPLSFSRTGSYRVRITAGFTDEFDRLMASYRAQPILYLMSDQYASTAVFGIYRNYNVEIDYPTHSLASLELEGLT